MDPAMIVYVVGMGSIAIIISSVQFYQNRKRRKEQASQKPSDASKSVSPQA